MLVTIAGSFAVVTNLTAGRSLLLFILEINNQNETIDACEYQ